MTGDEFISFARKLMTLPAARCPAGYRSVVSRLYFGAFHLTGRFVEDELGFRHRKSLDNSNKHQFILEYLVGSNEPHAQDLASQLSSLHYRRKNADYDLQDARYENEKFAADSVVRLDRIITALELCRDDHVRPTIQNGMATYRQRRSPPTGPS